MAKSLMNALEQIKCGDKNMVYCVKCGVKNPDDAKTCFQCGAPLYSLSESGQVKPIEKECFGTRRGVEPVKGWKKNVSAFPEAVRL